MDKELADGWIAAYDHIPLANGSMGMNGNIMGICTVYRMAYNGDMMKISWEYHIMGICSAQYDTRIIYIYIWVINE